MAQGQDTVQVELLGETFTVKADANEDEILKTSLYLQEQLDFMKTRYPTLSAKNLAILTAFRLADDFLRVRRDYDALVSILDKR